MAATFDSQATTVNPTLHPLSAAGISNCFQGVNEVSEFNAQDQPIPEKKRRLEKFWREKTRKHLNEMVCKVDQGDLEDPQCVAEYAEECFQ
jgi:hypothetical protein